MRTGREEGRKARQVCIRSRGFKDGVFAFPRYFSFLSFDATLALPPKGGGDEYTSFIFPSLALRFFSFVPCFI
jgi:hypothetical protein